MSDGPVKNLRLNSHWKQFASAVYNDAVDRTERCSLASNALVLEILTDNTQHLLDALKTYICQRQLDLDPLPAIENIFNGHSKTAFGDILQKKLVYHLRHLRHRVPLDVAFHQVLEESIDDQRSKARNRFEEECIRAHELGEIQQSEFDHITTQANEAFDAIAKDKIYDAIRAGNKNAFKDATAKKMDLNQGPSL